MRRKLITAWVFLPVMFLLFHWTRGEGIAAHDTASTHAATALAHERQNDWAAALKEYEAAIQALPQGKRYEVDRLRLQMMVQRARVRNGQIVDALLQLKNLRDDIASSEEHSAELDAVRQEIAVTSYYTAWLLRREGADRSAWERYAESARQDFRYLAEQTSGEASAKSQKNLEQVLWFERTSDQLFRPLALPDEALASNQSIAGEAEDAEETQTAQQEQGKGRNQGKEQNEGSSGGTGNVVRQGS